MTLTQGRRRQGGGWLDDLLGGNAPLQVFTVKTKSFYMRRAVEWRLGKKLKGEKKGEHCIKTGKKAFKMHLLRAIKSHLFKVINFNQSINQILKFLNLCL